MTTGSRKGFALIVATFIVVFGFAGRADAAGVAYSDPAVTGSIGLCDQNGHPVTTGRLTDRPFVARAVSSVPPPTGYSGAGSKATLFAFQPRPNVAPEMWNGDTLTASSTYSNPQVPMAEATKVDFRLQDYLDEYPTLVDGLIQLRMYAGIPGRSTYSLAYPALDIRVAGGSWSIVGPAANDLCSAGTARSSEVGLVPALNAAASRAPSTVPPRPGVSSGGTGGSSHPATGASTTTAGEPLPGSPATGSSSGGSSSEADPSAAELAARDRRNGSGNSPAVGIGLGVAAVVLIAGFVAWRRLRRIG